MILPLLIEAEQLQQQLSDPQLLIIDLSSEENYQQGHIPGAIHLPSSRLMCGQTPVPNKAPTPEQLQQLCNDLGLSADTHVIAYDDQKGPWAGRLMWTLNIAGHPHCSVLNGQLDSWVKAGFTLESTPNTATPSQYEMTLDASLIADKTFILEHLDDPDYQIWDARSAEEYSGEKVINAQKGGHIPGAIHFEWTDCLISDNDLRLRPEHELMDALEDAGIDPSKTVITHCQTHRRSGLTYLVAKQLGFNDIRCYDGSWFEWGNQADTPVERA